MCSRVGTDVLEDEKLAFSGNPQVMTVGIQHSKPINTIITIFYNYNKQYAMKYILTFQVKKRSAKIPKSASSNVISNFLVFQTRRTI